MTTLKDLEGTRWTGKCELYLDPEGNSAVTSDCTVAVDDAVVHYTWSHEGKEHNGTFTLRDRGATFTDSFHSPQPMPCEPVTRAGCLLAVIGSYSAGEGPRWGWLTTLSLRPTEELVLQMTNITPWGEDGRAVRMVCKRTT